ncbi:MAG TPA: MBL fold metallo-hydrolase [Burkholderiaceae bacterium]|jgi:glyoxylase-like metal-dependent hydrolase (beta-lactamase superfamily II)|nr:MBL fold metallo-hydrolase [Burkholderiaceae bacterium]
MTSSEEDSAVVRHLGHGIRAIDTGFHRPRFDAAYLIVEDGRAAFIDTGTNNAVPRLLDAVAGAGLTPDCVDWLIVTHVHLDHAGGAGRLFQALPKARFVVHPRGARHMIDPSALYESARGIYGDAEMERSYGRLVPVPAERVVTTHDGMDLQLGGRRLHFIDTPGHARHHHCIWDERSRGFFTGDTFGLSYREFDVDGRPWLLPTTTPIAFEPEELVASVRRMLAFEPDSLYLTHFGRVGDVARLGALMIEQVQAVAALALACEGDAAGRQKRLEEMLARHYLAGLRAHGCTLAEAEIRQLLALDIQLNAEGSLVWRKRMDDAARRAQDKS